MASQGNPELHRVLAALSSYVPRAVNSVNSQNNGSWNIPGLGFLPAPVSEPKPITPPPVDRLQGQYQPQAARPTSTTPTELRSTSTPPTVPDASTITTWPAALKHVTKYLVPDEKVATRIKHLISEQHKHERQWWTGREAILARQEGRSGTSQQVAALLQSIGGRAVVAAPADPKANAAELEFYDKKVYAGLIAMASDFDRQLRNLGVPFYAIRHELVILEQGPEKAGSVKGRLDKGELRELQKKMLQTLEDLFAD